MATTHDFKTAVVARKIRTGDQGIEAVSITDPDLNHLRLQILVMYGFLTEEQAEALFTAIVNGGTENGLEPLPCPEDLKLPVYDMIRRSLLVRPDSVDFVAEAIVIAEGVMWVADHWDEITDAVGGLWDAIFG